MKPEYNGITFDSPDEVELYHWAEEALDCKLITNFDYQRPTWQLSDPVIEVIPQFGKRGQPIKDKTRTVLQGSTYTADFHFHGIVDFLPISEFLDVKPKFSVRNDTARLFSLHRKWLYQRYNVLVHSVVPFELFQKTWAPELARLTPVKRQPRKQYAALPTVQEFVSTMGST